MNALTQQEIDRLLDLAEEARDHSYAPYSKYHVGAALLTADGQVVAGKTATLSSDQPSFKFSSLPKYKADGRTEIAYSVEEVEVAGYASEVGELADGKITVTNTQETTEIEVDKAWVNADGGDDWPAGVTV